MKENIKKTKPYLQQHKKPRNWNTSTSVLWLVSFILFNTIKIYQHLTYKWLDFSSKYKLFDSKTLPL
jgi:hypothetical protein